MLNKLVYSFLLFFLIPFVCNADWIKIFTISKGDLFIQSSSIKRDNNRIFYNQLVNYKLKQKNGSRSFITKSEVDCNSLRVRDVNYQLFKQQMGNYVVMDAINQEYSKSNHSLYYITILYEGQNRQ